MRFLIYKNSIYDYLFCAFIMALPFSLKMPNIFLIVLTLFFIIDYKDFKRLNFDCFKSYSFIILFLLLGYVFIKAIITNNISDNRYGLLIPIFIVPFLFLKITNTRKIVLAICATSLIIISIAVIGLAKNYLNYNTFLPFEGGSVNEILNMERPYLGFFTILSIIGSLHLYFSLPKHKYIFLFYTIFAIIFIFFISARISSLTIVFLLGLYLAFYLRVSLKNKLCFLLLGGIIILIIFSLSKNLRERLFILDNFQQSYAKFELYEPRVIIWPCVYEIINSADFQPLIGINSEGKGEDLLIKCYDNKISNKHRANFFITSEFNSHNQFLDVYLYYGILGLILLVLFFQIQFYKYRKDFFKISLLTALCLFFLVENLLSRQLGIYLFIITVCMVNIFPFNTSIKKS